MAGASNSDDTSEIFWPGYVDAVTNLAINLLFVIAVMAIVVITAILQISKMKPEQAVLIDAAQVTTTTDPKSAAPALPPTQAQTLQQAQAALNESALRQQMLSKELEQLQKKLAQLEKQAQPSQSAQVQLPNPAQTPNPTQSQSRTDPAASQSESASASEGGTSREAAPKSEVVQARQSKAQAPQGRSDLQDLSGGGVVVVFAPDVIDLAEPEVAELLRKLSAAGPIKGGRWQLRVISPKGFSEAARLAYYRLNALRNILMKNGASAGDIEMRLIEAEGSNANNARVLVRPL